MGILWGKTAYISRPSYLYQVSSINNSDGLSGSFYIMKWHRILAFNGIMVNSVICPLHLPLRCSASAVKVILVNRNTIRGNLVLLLFVPL